MSPKKTWVAGSSPATGNFIGQIRCRQRKYRARKAKPDTRGSSPGTTSRGNQAWAAGPSASPSVGPEGDDLGLIRLSVLCRRPPHPAPTAGPRRARATAATVGRPAVSQRQAALSYPAPCPPAPVPGAAPKIPAEPRHQQAASLRLDPATARAAPQVWRPTAAGRTLWIGPPAARMPFPALYSVGSALPGIVPAGARSAGPVWSGLYRAASRSTRRSQVPSSREAASQAHRLPDARSSPAACRARRWSLRSPPGGWASSGPGRAARCRADRWWSEPDPVAQSPAEWARSGPDPVAQSPAESARSGPGPAAPSPAEWAWSEPGPAVPSPAEWALSGPAQAAPRRVERASSDFGSAPAGRPLAAAGSRQPRRQLEPPCLLELLPPRRCATPRPGTPEPPGRHDARHCSPAARHSG